MTIEQKRTLALATLRRERECVSRDCDRDCENCELAEYRDTLLAGYDAAIEILEKGRRKPYESVKKLPCQKCGSKHLSVWMTGDGSGKPMETVRCDRCGISGDWSYTTIGAIRAWNALQREEKNDG